jgi:hypothetical protein
MPGLSVLFAGEADIEQASDAVDLPRLAVAVEPDLSASARAALDRLTLPGQVATAEARSRRWGVIVASTAWIDAAGGAEFLARHGRALVLTDQTNRPAQQKSFLAGFTPWSRFPALLLPPDLARLLADKPA